MTKQKLYEQYYTQNYSTVDLMEDFKYCYKQLCAIYPEIEANHYDLIFNYTALKRFGYCLRKKQGNYEIQINYHFARICDKEKIRNTIMHELIHSLKDCMCHTGKWHVVCNRINHEYGYDLTRTSYYPEYTNFRNKVKPTTRLSKKYLITCVHCGHTWNYSKQSKLIKELMNVPNSTRYSCPYCKHKNFNLKVVNDL